jgi:hypothetical protein
MTVGFLIPACDSLINHQSARRGSVSSELTSVCTRRKYSSRQFGIVISVSWCMILPRSCNFARVHFSNPTHGLLVSYRTLVGAKLPSGAIEQTPRAWHAFAIIELLGTACAHSTGQEVKVRPWIWMATYLVPPRRARRAAAPPGRRSPAAAAG